ncbi:NADH dehydrogenase [ubiquinone] iron-sulfur protein 6, mitochondrial-like [Oppia nitens]|uniref:NADH dehydrogenase [ubiquinone] iron-sulfur protein 6, mitochondrial-like n=1 Tax=Oppia nitens TaxID=1686743 RepID=UPI0023DB29E7|nr:NADH dehydrogenase [ubiquinone] iron-sulfur protein 6, mitochondrial-like [Oppia nitens]
MALNYIKGVQNKSSIDLIRHWYPFVTKCFASTNVPKVTSNDLKIYEDKADKRMKEKVLDRQTHTGQTFAKDDYRLVRFVGKQKEINPRFAIDLIAEVQPISAKNRWVSCDGGGGPLGHPKVFINLDDPGEYGTCGYCGLRFYKDTDSGHSHH